MFKKLIEILKRLFFVSTEPEVEPSNSGETIDIEESVDSGQTESAVTVIDISEPEDEPENIESGFVSDFVILIDCGHGNNTAGKRSPYSANNIKPEIEFFEYKWNREIGKQIVNELVELGYDARLLVTEDIDISLTERCKRANNVCRTEGKDNVLLVSVHSNAAGNGSKWMTARGWEAFTTKGKTKSDTLADFLYDEAEKNFSGLTIRKETSDGDRDWEANFTIIYKTLCPAVLTENFFYDNIDDVKYILSEEGRKAVIKTHVDGIINFIKNEEDERHKQGYYKTGRC